MIWQDKISDILDMINGASLYNLNRSTTPTGLGLKLINRAKDWLCTYKAWNDLLVSVSLTIDSNKKAAYPDDYGSTILVYCDPSNIGKPMWIYTLNDNDVAKRYTEERTFDPSSGFTRKICFPPTVVLPGVPTLIYSKVLEDYTGTGVEYSFFPMNIMVLVVKKMLQDFHGIAANDDPNWINQRVMDELRVLEGYAYNNNVALDMAIKDIYGNPIRIPGATLDGSQQRTTTPSPFLPSTLFTGGTY